MSIDEFRRVGHRAVDLLADHLASLPNRPCRTPVPAAVQHALMYEPLPEAATGADTLLDDLESTVFRYPMGNGSPRFFGWVNSPPAPMGIIGECLAAGLNPSVAGGDHAATYIEHAALGWMRSITGYPSTSGGILTSGGSVANLIGLAVMRHIKSGRTVRAHGLRDVEQLVVYTSTEGHSCIQKAIELLGIGNSHLRRVPVTAEWQMDVEALRGQIERDRLAGLTPACIVATAGTVNTGTIDPLNVIADLCASERLWFHVDAAYGGPGALLAELAPLYRGLERADSVAVDPHKWMYVPVECGCALVSDAEAMRDTFSLVPPYLRDDAALPWFSEFGIQQSRGFRALKLWLAVKYAGIGAYREAIAKDVALAKALRSYLHVSPDFEVVAAGPLSITCFRYQPGDNRSDADIDHVNRTLLDAVQQEGEVFLTGTELSGRFVLRACIVNFRTAETDVERLVNVVRRAGQRVKESLDTSQG
ncbi:MAG TPA: pyridoxal-dependent decarboxylase [Vicinamibacterales bacterium]|jgi:glutamate/tyrosine decarboxylase-like PLP-dependent enzyme